MLLNEGYTFRNRKEKRTMNQRTFKFRCGEVANYWGDRMPMMVMEEAGELIRAISKFERAGCEPDSDEYKGLIDEIGDMMISLKALECHYWELNTGRKTIETLVEERIEKKLNKKYEKEPEHENYNIGYEDLTDEQHWDEVENDCFTW